MTEKQEKTRNRIADALEVLAACAAQESIKFRLNTLEADKKAYTDLHKLKCSFIKSLITDIE